jgi:hypothetical protein
MLRFEQGRWALSAKPIKHATQFPASRAKEKSIPPQEIIIVSRGVLLSLH